MQIVSRQIGSRILSKRRGVFLVAPVVKPGVLVMATEPATCRHIL